VCYSVLLLDIINDGNLTTVLLLFIIDQLLMIHVTLESKPSSYHRHDIFTVVSLCFSGISFSKKLVSKS